MDWATGQHIMKSTKPSYRQQLNARLLHVAHLNLHRNGLPFGECFDKRNVVSLRGRDGVLEDESLNPTNLLSQGENAYETSGITKEEMLQISERERRHGLLISSLYRRPEGLVQIGHAESMDAHCHSHHQPS